MKLYDELQNNQKWIDLGVWIAEAPGRLLKYWQEDRLHALYRLLKIILVSICAYALITGKADGDIFLTACIIGAFFLVFGVHLRRS